MAQQSAYSSRPAVRKCHGVVLTNNSGLFMDYVARDREQHCHSSTEGEKVITSTKKRLYYASFSVLMMWAGFVYLELSYCTWRTDGRTDGRTDSPYNYLTEPIEDNHMRLDVISCHLLTFEFGNSNYSRQKYADLPLSLLYVACTSENVGEQIWVDQA